MADINKLLESISKARYGRDVRQSIVDAIKQCYTDMQALNPDTTKILTELNKIKDSMEEGDEILQEDIDKLNEHIDNLMGETIALNNSTVDLFDYCKRLNNAISASNEEINQLSEVLDVATVTSRINNAHIITGATNYALQGFTAYGRALRAADEVTPDNISDIKVTDKVSLVIAGKQLVNLGRINKTVNGIEITTLDGVATIDGKAEVIAETILLDQELTLPPGSYYIASNCDDNRVFAEVTLLVDDGYTYVKEGRFNITGKEAGVYFRLMLDPTANEFFNDVVIKPMLCSGTSEALFEPCKIQENSYSVPVDLYGDKDYFAGVPVTTNGNFIDQNGQEWISDSLTYDPTGKTIHTRRIQRLSVKEYLSGDVHQLDVSSVDGKIVFSIPSLPKPLAEGLGICNALPVHQWAGSTIITTDESVPDAICVTAEGTLNFFSSSFTSLNLETWLKENDIILYYPLAEPVVTERALAANEALLFMYADYSMAYTKEGDMFTLTYIGQYKTLDEIVLNSCTEGSTKKFLVKIDDDKNILIEEL